MMAKTTINSRNAVRRSAAMKDVINMCRREESAGGMGQKTRLNSNGAAMKDAIKLRRREDSAGGIEQID